ncbi:MAG: choice-of-anchor J domain-containing protein [Sphingobacteriales bacterium]|nr:MAG: choice-of-anchor J domain-containing protein [Sphingobacteriales bacterium]
MIKITTINRILMSIALLTTLSITSCKKDNFDEPPHEITDPNIANTTIAELRSLFTSGNPITVTDDIIIGGVVTADDRTGNFYKQFIIQDSTGAIPVLVNKSGLYTDYPVGRKVYIKCNGLVLGQYGNNKQLGGYIDYTGAQPSVGEIQSALVNNYIVKGPMVTPIVPRKISSFAQLNLTTDQSILIELDPVSFDDASAGVPYANIVTEQSLSRTILDCEGNEFLVRTSNFSTFANTNTPAATEKVSIIGIYSVYRTDKQFAIRDINEVATSTTTCPAVPVEVVLFSENFNGVSTSGNLAISGWTNFSTAGTKYWYGTGSSTNKNARVSAYNSGQTSNVAWLITPSINLDGSTGETLNFRTNIYQPAGATILEVLYSSDYSGSGNPSTATWNVLGSVPNVTTAWSAATPISLNSISGNIYIAFRYTGGDPGNTTQYNIDDVSVSYFE